MYLLPYPPSLNAYRLHDRRGFTYPSKKAREYKLAVHDIVGKNTTDKNVQLSIKLMPKLTKKGLASKQCLDLDNCLKVALDALQGCLYDNDNQVKRILLEYGEPVENGGLLIECEIME